MCPRRYILGPTLCESPFEGARFAVRIADDLRKATVFVGEELANHMGESAIDPRATGFFVAWRSDSGRPIENMQPESCGIYLVTARHVAIPLGRMFVIRFNKKGGGSDIEMITNAQWQYHPDKMVDVAVLHCGYPDWADCVPIPGRLLVKPSGEHFGQFGGFARPTDPIISIHEVGVGDLAYVVGLFHLLHGQKINLPITHVGHIALLPEDEKIPVEDRITGEINNVEGYLVEAHGLEGLSGAPVFVRSSAPVTAKFDYHGRPLQGGHRPEHPIHGRLHSWTFLLGLWQSSWDGEPAPVLAMDKKLEKNRRVPVGMGVVVPAEKIAETLNQPDLVMQRQKEYQRRSRENASVTDSLSSDDENPSHREDFTSLLNAAAKTRKQGDQASPDETNENSGDK
jgi:hypothetical protein